GGRPGAHRHAPPVPRGRRPAVGWRACSGRAAVGSPPGFQKEIRVSPSRPAAVVVLAACPGTRMRSATPKVLHPMGGRALLGHAMTAARAVDPERLAVVVRHERERVAAYVAEADPSAVLVDQDD